MTRSTLIATSVQDYMWVAIRARPYVGGSMEHIYHHRMLMGKLVNEVLSRWEGADVYYNKILIHVDWEDA